MLGTLVHGREQMLPSRLCLEPLQPQVQPSHMVPCMVRGRCTKRREGSVVKHGLRLRQGKLLSWRLFSWVIPSTQLIREPTHPGWPVPRAQVAQSSLGREKEASA